MLEAKSIINQLISYNFSLFTGVPCSILKDLFSYTQQNSRFIAAKNEGEAVAIASGAVIGGEKAVVMLQNSGLGNIISPLTSLNEPFQIPILAFIGFRGEPLISDEPQHQFMGSITTQMLDLLKIDWAFLSENEQVAKKQIHQANKMIEKKKSFFFVVKKGIFNSEKSSFTAVEENSIYPTRYDCLLSIVSCLDQKSVLVTTTGKTGRELHEIRDTKQHFYMVGSMGCASSLSLGLALSQKEKKFIVLDGDGALLMRMESLTTNGYYRPDNMLHILLDNQVYDSTGGQSTCSSHINFASIAASSGYQVSKRINSIKQLEKAITDWYKQPQLTFLHIRIQKGSKKNLARPTLKPNEVKERLEVFFND